MRRMRGARPLGAILKGLSSGAALAKLLLMPSAPFTDAVERSGRPDPLRANLCRRIPCPSTGAASIVIPNWNGRDLLEKYLPSVIAAIQSSPGS